MGLAAGLSRPGGTLFGDSSEVLKGNGNPVAPIKTAS